MPRVEVEIESLAKGGDGVARHEGRAVFVERAVPGDRLSIDLVERAGRVLHGLEAKVLRASPDRVIPACPIADRCGGCAWMHFDVAAQRRAKERIFGEALERIGGVDRGRLRLEPIVAAPVAIGYRRRARLHVRKGEVGYLREGTHELIAIEHCPILEPVLEAALPRLIGALRTHALLGRTREIDLVCEGSAWSFALHLDALSGVVRDRVERVVRATGARGAMILAPSALPTRVETPELGSLRPDVFAQVSAASNAGLVEAVVEQAGAIRDTEVLELFAGSGNFTLPLAAAGARVVAIEQAGPALGLLRASANRRGLGASIRIVEGDALDRGRALASEGRVFRTLVLDPPRSGCSGLGSVARGLGVERIVYVSCDPATLARDVGELAALGWQPVWARPFDLFPQTPHVEGVVRLEK